MSKLEVFRILAKLDATRAEAYFSGGNDEGGVDSVKVTKSDGSLYDLPGYFWGDDVREYLEDEKRLVKLLSGPVDARYGTFAGDFYVHGKVVADKTTGEFRMSRDESVPTWSHQDDNLY